MRESVGSFEPYQDEILEDLKGKMGNNPDFVSPDTYGRIFDSANLKQGDTVLDIGAGYIHVLEDYSYTSKIENRGLILIPIDEDVERLQSWMLHPYQARKENETVVRPVHSDAADMPFADGTVAFALSINLINAPESVHTAEDIIADTYRVLKPEGQMLISSFGYFRIKNPDGSIEYNNGFSEDQFITADDVRSIAENIGFASVEDVPQSQEAIDSEFGLVQESLKKEGKELVEIIHHFALLLKK